MDKPFSWRADGVSIHRTPGFVYFVQAENGGLIKIGWATNPVARVANMQMVCPVILVILLSVPGNGKLERSLHGRFDPYREHGEWFEPAPELLELIEAWRASPPRAPEWPTKKPVTVATAPKKRPIMEPISDERMAEIARVLD